MAVAQRRAAQPQVASHESLRFEQSALRLDGATERTECDERLWVRLAHCLTAALHLSARGESVLSSAGLASGWRWWLGPSTPHPLNAVCGTARVRKAAHLCPKQLFRGAVFAELGENLSDAS